MKADTTILKAAVTLEGCQKDIREGNINFATGVELAEWVCHQYQQEYGHVPKEWQDFVEFLKKEEGQ